MSSRPTLSVARRCVWSDDGTALAVATDTGAVVWRLGAGLSLQVVGPAERLDAVAFAGDMLWTAGSRKLRCHDLGTGAPVERVVMADIRTNVSLAGRLWVGEFNSTITVGELDGQGEERRIHRPDIVAARDEDDRDDWDFEEGRVVTCVAVAPDGRRMLAGYADGACWMFDLRGDAHRQLQAPGEPMVSAAAWSPAGDLVVVGGAGRFALRVGPQWKPQRYPPRATALSDNVTAIAFSPVTAEIAVSSWYDSPGGGFEDLEFIRLDAIDERANHTHVQIRDIPTRRHIRPAHAAAYDPSGRVLALCLSAGGSGVALWDVDGRSYLGTLRRVVGLDAGMLTHEPRTIGEGGRIELIGDTAALARLGDDLYAPWTSSCMITSGRGELAAALARRLAGSKRR